MGHLHNGMLLGHKKRKKLSFATVWMNQENIMLSKISQSGKDKYIVPLFAEKVKTKRKK